MRRIITAREQVELLSPWRTAMPIFHHLTDDPDFKLNPKFSPETFYEEGGSTPKPEHGLYVTSPSHLDRWREDYEWDRPYTAEIDVPDHVLNDPKVKSRTDYAPMDDDPVQAFIPAQHFDQLRVKSVKPTSHFQAMSEIYDEQVEQLSPWREAAVPDWERKLINRNTATDVNDEVHKLDWDGSKGYGHGERSSGLTPTCSCGWSSDAGSEAAGRRGFTQHIKSIERRATRQAMSEIYDEYAGHHQSPGPGTGFPVWDMTGEHQKDDEIGGVPEDWYTHPQYYSSGSNGVGAADMRRTQKIYNDTRGKPEHPVTIYRALPHGNTTFNTGDWVTPSLAYAKQHAAQSDDPSEDWPVIKSTVPAKHLYQNGDSYDEMGYHGPGHQGTVV
jgi:hypothetical protein